MRKRFILLLVATIILGGIPMGAFGQVAYDKDLEHSISRVKSLFNISDNYDTFNSQVNTSGNEVFFYLNWSDSNNELDNISVTTDNLGNIISFQKYNPIYVQPDTKSPTYSIDEALQKAKSFIQRIAPDLYNNLELNKNRYPISAYDIDYSFHFVRIINKIPYPDNTVNINVNKYTGEITNFYSNWERILKFPDTENVLSIEEGKNAFKDNIGLDLIYKSSNRLYRLSDTNEEIKHFLAYSILNQGRMIDAVTGEAINNNYYGGMGSAEMAMDSKSEAGITPEERAEIDKLVGIIDSKQIEKIAREILSIDNEYILQSKNLYSNYKNPGDYQWSLYFTKKVESNFILVADIILDAKTSELLSFSKSNKIDSDDKPTITKEESLELAKAFITNQQPENVDNLEFMGDYISDSTDDQQVYYFSFIRKIDDLYVESDSINVGVDTVNKDIISYNFDWFRGKFPPKGDLIGIDKAYDILFKEIGYELRYATIYDYEKPQGENREIKLVYALNCEKPPIIHANTGEILDYSGDVYRDFVSFGYTDIDFSYAKDKISTLAQYGVGFNSERFKPKEEIKQKDFIYLLFKSINTYRDLTEEDIDKIYDEFTKSHIIKDGEREPERIVTKEEAVMYVIRAMNYAKIAEIPEIFQDIFDDSADITPGLNGHINIAFGLGIIEGDGNGNINPKGKLKREDAASIIYNYMFN